MQLKGKVSMPIELDVLLSSISEESEDKNGEEPTDTDEEKSSTDYLKAMKRVDLMLMCMFYGLYISKELPPLDLESFPLEGSYEFNVNIENEVKILRHVLFLIWITENGPTDLEFDMDHRRSLYDFLEKILDNDFVVKVVFPFYLVKSSAAYGDVSFIDRLSQSRHVPYELHPFSPEAVAMEYYRVRYDFEAYIGNTLDSFINPG